MCEVFWFNFDEKYKNVKESMEKAAMISFDCELTGLHAKEEFQPSLFDSGAERYSKLRAGVDQLLVIQLGLTAFMLNKEEDAYLTETYTFYLLPTSFLSVDTRFVCQASCLCFLSYVGFDYNKLFSEGIPYLSPEQEKKLRLDLKKDRPALACNLSSDLRAALERACWQVSQWTPSAIPGQSLKIYPHPKKKLEEMDDDNTIPDASMPPSLTSQLRENLIHRELRLTFPDIWTYAEDGDVLRIEKINEDERRRLETEEMMKIKEEYGEEVFERMEVDCLAEKTIQILLGATKIFRLLIDVKKPIIGHNCLLDLMVLLKQFYCPLPEKYKDFKKVIHEIFPEVYDTKVISFEVRVHYSRGLKFYRGQQNKPKRPDKELWEMNSLPSIYSFFDGPRGFELTADAIKVQRMDQLQESATEARFHNAGWDSYCTGYCFLRLGHIKAVSGNRLSNRRGLEAGEHLRGIVEYRNFVNLMQARSPYLRLDKDDPCNFRPPYLHIESRKVPINITKVKWMLSAYGSVDVKKCSTYCATIAAVSDNCYYTILKAFSYRDDYSVTKIKTCTNNRLTLFLHLAIAVSATGLIIMASRNIRSRAMLTN